MVTPLSKPKKVVKRRKAFVRQQSGRALGDKNGKKEVAASWRRPRGIDSRVRRRFRGSLLCPKIGYGSNKVTRHRMPNGFYRFVVHNVGELEVLMMQNRKFAAEIASNVSTRLRKAIVERAAALDIKVTNAFARLREEEQE
eukprot:GILI01010080.1.p2 GENE.GILI01010080.1~~GILI01010080.1.p2  ORF type:complete len:151 (-),score=46.22 GILI01010080.1:42-464(-)